MLTAACTPDSITFVELGAQVSLPTDHHKWNINVCIWIFEPAPTLIRPANENNGKGQKKNAISLTVWHLWGSPTAPEQLSLRTVLAIYSSHITNSSNVPVNHCHIELSNGLFMLLPCHPVLYLYTIDLSNFIFFSLRHPSVNTFSLSSGSKHWVSEGHFFSKRSCCCFFHLDLINVQTRTWHLPTFFSSIFSTHGILASYYRMSK